MIYYVTGINARHIQLENLYQKYDNVRVYDAIIPAELNNFYEDINNVSLFNSNDLVILRRTEKLKKFDELLTYLENHKDENKSIVIDYFCEYKGKNPYLNKFKKIGAQIINVEDSVNSIEEYVMKKLGITKSETKKLLEIIGYDYMHVKNEIFKYKSIINEKYSFDKIKDLILEKQDKKINEYLQEIYSKKINFDSIKKEYYIQLIYAIYKDFEIFHKLNILKLSKDYSEFKEQYKEYESIFKLNYYVVFLKYKLLNFDKKKCMKILKICNNSEYQLKSGLIDDKTALWYIIKEIQND